MAKIESNLLISCNLNYIKKHTEAPPGGPVVENPPSRVGNAGLILGPGTEAPRAVEQLGPLSLRARAAGEAPARPGWGPAQPKRYTVFKDIEKHGKKCTKCFDLVFQDTFIVIIKRI